MLYEISTDFVIDARTRQPGSSMSCAHAHQYNEIYFMLDGNCNVSIEDQTYALHPGSILFIPAFLSHYFTYEERTTPIKRTVLYISTDQLKWYFSDGPEGSLDILFQVRLFHFSSKNTTYIEHLFQKIQAEKYKKDSYSLLLTKTYFFELIIFMIQKYQNEETSDEKSELSLIQIGQILKYIDNHYAEKLTLPHIADKFSLSESGLSRKIKAATGQTFKEYLNHIRIESSKHYLATTEKNITEVAFLCGYSNSHRYGDAFKQIVGISPGRFRKLISTE